MNLPPYPETYQAGGYTYTLCAANEEEGAALYEQHNSAGKLRGFEVLKMRWRPERTTTIGTLAAGWQLPRPEDFGRYAWSYSSREAAKAKFSAIRNGGRP